MARGDTLAANEEVVSLPDGRRVGIASHGDSQGRTLFPSRRLPVHLWHGEEDRIVSVHHAEDMASRLPHVALHMLPHTGHLSVARHFGAMLDVLPSD